MFQPKNCIGKRSAVHRPDKIRTGLTAAKQARPRITACLTSDWVPPIVIFAPHPIARANAPSTDALANPPWPVRTTKKPGSVSPIPFVYLDVHGSQVSISASPMRASRAPPLQDAQRANLTPTLPVPVPWNQSRRKPQTSTTQYNARGGAPPRSPKSVVSIAHKTEMVIFYSIFYFIKRGSHPSR